jgi:preprotein translocase subunit Sss1
MESVARILGTGLDALGNIGYALGIVENTPAKTSLLTGLSGLLP